MTIDTMRRLIFVCLLAAFASSPVTAQDERNCFDCNKTGFQPCTSAACKKATCQFLKTEHTCMKIFTMPCCRGFKKIPCKICGHLNSKAEFENEMENRKAWVDEMEKLSKDIKGDLDHIQTENFRLHYGIEKIKVGDNVYDRNVGMHLYASRMEECLADFRKWWGEPCKMPTRGYWEVFVFKNPAEKSRGAATICGSNGVSSLYGVDTSKHLVGWKEEAVTTDEELHGHLYHHVSQIILQMGDRPGTRKFPGWISEGYAHFIEEQKFGTILNWCTSEVNQANDPWRAAGEFKTKVFGLVRRGKEPQFSTFCDRDTRELSGPLHGLSYAFVDFLLKNHKDKAGDLMRAIVGGQTTAQAFQGVFGWSLARVHEEWRKWVEKAYAPQ